MSGGSVPVATAKVVLPPPFPDAPKTLTFVRDERLEACLRDFRSSPAARHLSFALVDLTTVMEGSQFKGPFAYAALRDDKRYYVASLAKIAIILGAYRLRRSVADAANVSQAADAKTLFADIATAWRGPINKLFSGPADDFPKLNRIFDVSGPPGGRTIRFTDKFWKQLVGIVQNSNRAAADCISDIGFNFINGTLVKEGLVNEKKQGLWLGGSYSATTWESTKYRMHGATALSVARFFTLLHTGQLVDHEASRNMRYLMDYASAWFDAHLLGAKSYGKIGVVGEVPLHEGAVISRPDPNLFNIRYAAVGLNMPSQAALKTLILKLDQCIVARHLLKGP